MSKMRRASVVLTMSLVLGLLLSLETALAFPIDDKQPPKAEPVPAIKPAAMPAQNPPPPVVVGGGPVLGGKGAPLRAVPLAQAKPPGAPAPTAKGEGDFTDAITLPTDRQVKQRLEAAREDFLKSEDWVKASQLLQQVLNNKEDVFVQVRRKEGNGPEKVRWVSARAEANRLLGTMPARGLEFYELQNGAEARRLLAEGRKNGDPQLLAEVSQRYFHTQAGAEATDLLGTYHLDRGRPLIAALCYERLLQREGADQLTPLVLFKASLAFRLAGDQENAGEAQRTWKQLAARVGHDGLRVGDDVVTLEQLQTELQKATRPEASGPFDWALFRGNVSRSAKARGSAPLLVSVWRKELNKDERMNTEARAALADAIERPESSYKSEPLLPATFPIAAAGKLIFKTYLGVTAIDIKTHALAWESVNFHGSLHEIMSPESDAKQQVKEWLGLYQTANRTIILENSTLGTLSCDNHCVYAIDDLVIPPHPASQTMQVWGGMAGGPQLSGKLAELAGRSQLIAINLDNGKLEWERGDPKNDSTKLVGSFFLGPPLPLDGKLYVLTENTGELRLVCLDAAKKGEPLWMQTLATTRERLLNDVSRRVHAVQLAYGDGILVCPTNAGAVLGVDLLSRTLVWAFPYREKTAEPVGRAGMGAIFRGGGRPLAVNVWGAQDFPGSLQRMSADWKMCAPIIQEGKVVFAAPDGKSIHCLNLQDGDPIWQADKRDEDLYMAGVFDGKVLLIGKKTCRALSLQDGKEMWQVETGMPSGQGVASGPYYYLPLKKGEVCKIDLEKHLLVPGSLAASKDEVPGNLLFYEGEVVSQDARNLLIYDQVDSKVAAITARLQKNPQDPEALAERGELRLYNGDLAGAVADLRDSIRHAPAPKTLAEARAKLFTGLTELLQRDFSTAEQYLEEYRELCKITIPESASEAKRQELREEERSRQAGYYCLLARGREEQGKVLDAFHAYVEFADRADPEKNLTIINEPSVQAKPNVWANGRIQALLSRASSDDRARLAQEVAQRWQSVRAANDIKALERFVRLFGSLFAEGREAQLQLAERLLDTNLTGAELQLIQLSRQHEDRLMAARAIEALARLYTRKGDLPAATECYRELGRDFATTVIRDGKTGADLFKDLATDKRFLPYLEEPVSPFAIGSLKTLEISERYSPQRPAYPFEAKGETSAFFKGHRLTWSFLPHGPLNAFQLRVLDRDSDQELWSLTGPPTRVSYDPSGTSVRFPYYSVGHFVVLYLGHTLYGVDMLEHKKLWEKELLPPERAYGEHQPNNWLALDAEGGLVLAHNQGTAERLGQIALVTPAYVCIKTPEGLTALDPSTGTVLWTKSDVSSQTRVFGDEELVYLIDLRDNNSVGSPRAVRGRDGATVSVPDFSGSYLHRQRILGGHLFLSEKDARENVVFRLYDVRSGKDSWTNTLPAGTVLLQPDDPNLAATVEPGGKLTVTDLASGKEIFQTAVLPAHMDKVNEGLLLHDDRQFYVVLNRPNGPENTMQGPWPNAIGLRTATVNGTVYAFDRTSGKIDWYAAVPHQMILLERFDELPMVLFTAKYHKKVDAPANSFQPVAATLTIDKRTGKRLYDREVPSGYPPQSYGQFLLLRIDRQSAVVDLISTTLRLRHYVGSGGNKVSSNRNSREQPAVWIEDARMRMGGVRPAQQVPRPQRVVPAVQRQAIAD